MIIYLGFVSLLTICGILISLYLSISHYRVYTDIGYSSFCAISKAINCDTVSQSPYSIFLGLPVAIWGIIGYFILLITLFLSFDVKSKKISNFPTLFFIGLVFSFISVLFGAISAFKIHSYCIMCIVTYGINFMLLYTIWLTKQRFKRNSWWSLVFEDMTFWKNQRNKAFKYFSPIIIITLLLIIFFPHYWSTTFTDPVSWQLKTGITEDGDPWIGAENPGLTIIEYTDYMCFQCKKMHFFLKNLIATYPDKIKLVHKHFPMDQKYNPNLKENLHPGSGILSLIAIYAAKENKFWEINDYLYHYTIDKAIYLNQIAQESGLDLPRLKKGVYDPETLKKLQGNILSGIINNISGTPSYIIDNKIYAGQIPSDILNSIKK